MSERLDITAQHDEELNQLEGIHLGDKRILSLYSRDVVSCNRKSRNNVENIFQMLDTHWSHFTLLAN